MLFSHLIVIVLIVIVFCVIVQHASNLYIYRKLHNQGTNIKSAKNIAQDVSILMAAFYGILVFILICIAIQTFNGSVIV